MSPVTFEDWGFDSCNPPYNYVSGVGYAHLGADSQGTHAGQTVVAIGAGTVVSYHPPYWGPGAALGIETVAGDGTRFIALYGHVTASVSVGNSVVAGQAIATLWDQGSNSHLHLGVRPLSPGENAGSVPLLGSARCTSTASPPTGGFVDPIPWLAAHAPGGGGGGFTGYVAAFQANTGSLWTVGAAGASGPGDMQLGMAAGTSPALSALSNGSWEVAFQANTGSLWTVGNDSHGAWNLGMMPGSSPSIAGLTGGGYVVAFQANTGHLWVVGAAGASGPGDTQLGMMPGTSPVITPLSNGSWEVAFQANTGSLWTVGNDSHGAWNLGMMPGSSPSIAGLTGGGYVVAFQANTGHLWVVGAAGASGPSDTQLGIMPRTSPAITPLSNGSWEVAFQANTGSLWTVGNDSHGAWNLGMMSGTSPCIAGLSSGYVTAFQANTGSLWTVGAAGASGQGAWNLGMMSGTSPAIAGRYGGSCAPAAPDSNPPSVAITSKPANPVASTSASFGFTGSDVGSPPVSISCALDGPTWASCTSPKSYSGLSNGVHTFFVRATDQAGNISAAQAYQWRVDTVAPAAGLTAPTGVATLSSSVKVSWTGSDTGGSGVAKYQVRYTRATYSGGFAAWVYPSSWQALTTTSLAQTGLAQGYDYCWSVRAIDGAGNTSAWSANKCTAVALDDRALAASSGWTRATSSAWWNSTASTTKTLNTTLTRTSAQLDRVGIVATKCASCGIVGIYVGSTLIGKINLYAASTAYRQLILLPKFTYRTGTVVVKTLTSSKTIQIDGLAISRT